ncbi:MAG: endonuclease III [Sphingomonadales bacterium]
MTRAEKYKQVTDYFLTHAPAAETELLFENPYQLLVAVVLSAQCTDKRVNQTTPILFAAYPDIPSLAKATPQEVFTIIKSISYPNNKAKHLVALANKVIKDFEGRIPMTVEELVQLPGVGRKTANVITSVIDHQPNMAVDTHVFRVSHRLGLVPTTATTTLAVEKWLTKFFPESLIHRAHHWLILHGRYTCVARSPRCHDCELRPLCRFYAKERRMYDKKK